MKHVFGPDKPEYVVDGWPGQFTNVFCWLSYLLPLPYTISVITTRKENGAPNACPSGVGMLIGAGNEFSSLIAVYTHHHTYENILREKEWCINIPHSTMAPMWDRTIRNNGPENDEITDAGFTVEPSQTIKSPRIAECLINLECRLEWDRLLYEGSNTHLFCGHITALAMDESLVNCGTDERLRALNQSYGVQGQINPFTGQSLDPAMLLTILQHDLK